MTRSEPVQFGELWFHPSTPDPVRQELLRAYRGGYRIRVFCGNVETGEAWEEEHDIMGTVGRSTGRFKVPLLIASSRSSGGHAILDHCIVAIQRGPGNYVYRHPSFTLGKWEVKARPVGADGQTSDHWAVLHNGQFWGSCGNQHGKAVRLRDFMAGQRWSK